MLVVHLFFATSEPSHAEGVLKDHVGIKLTEEDLHIFHVHVQSEGHVLSKFLLEKWNLWSDEGGIELYVISFEHLVHGHSVQMETADWGLGNGVHNAGESAFSDNDLREGLRVHELHVVWVKSAGSGG